MKLEQMAVEEKDVRVRSETIRLIGLAGSMLILIVPLIAFVWSREIKFQVMQITTDQHSDMLKHNGEQIDKVLELAAALEVNQKHFISTLDLIRTDMNESRKWRDEFGTEVRG